VLAWLSGVHLGAGQGFHLTEISNALGTRSLVVVEGKRFLLDRAGRLLTFDSNRVHNEKRDEHTVVRCTRSTLEKVFSRFPVSHPFAD